MTLEEAYKKAIRCAASEAVKTIKALIAEHVSLMSVDEKLSIVDMLDCDEEIARRRQEVKVAT
ncbi:MAG: hypothetical protein GY826_35865 [Fuerstiella sp.]|nr:hypothetical protein [Fuerstiella sp.]